MCIGFVAKARATGKSEDRVCVPSRRGNGPDERVPPSGPGKRVRPMGDSEGHACRARRSGMDHPTLRSGPDKRVPPRGPGKRVRPMGDSEGHAR
jgi:hypothetical protein